MDDGILLILYSPLLAIVSLVTGTAIWTLLTEVVKVRIAFFACYAIVFAMMSIQFLALLYLERNISFQYARTQGLVYVSVALVVALYPVFRVTLRRDSGEAIRPLPAFIVSIVNVLICALIFKGVFNI